jgi:hypothetical protein
MRIFDDEEGRREREALANSAGDYLDSLEDPQRSYGSLRFFALVDVLLLVFAAIAADWIYSLKVETFLYLVAVAAAIGFIMAFSALRLHQNTVSTTREVDRIEKGVMGGYMYAATQQRKYVFWMLAAAAGALNAALFLAVAAFFE